jgi:hypothetical protein
MKVHGKGGTAADWLFLAMAEHRLGHADEAKKWLTKSQQSIDRSTQEKLKKGAGAAPFGWSERVELKLIRAEAEALMKEGQAKK